jgi:hypothetical protein
LRCQIIGDLVPDKVRLRMPVQQQERRAAPANTAMDIYAVSDNLLMLEPGEHLTG